MAADDRLSGARNIGVLDGARVLRNSIGSRDKSDYYALTVNNRSSFNLSLTNLQNDVDVSLIQNGRAIAISNRRKNRSEKISTTLEAGTYYVRVYQKRGGSKYQLNLNAVPLSQPISPNPSLTADLFYNNVFLSGTSVAYDCGLNNNPTSCAAFQRVSSVLSDGCNQGSQTACSLLLELTEIEAAARIISTIGSF
jgi:Bacterial pre-peptidase C-terminal domain